MNLHASFNPTEFRRYFWKQNEVRVIHYLEMKVWKENYRQSPAFKEFFEIFDKLPKEALALLAE